MKILDIGANNGSYAKNLCKLGLGNNSVVSVEANPYQNPNLDGYDITWINKAVSSVANKTVNLHIAKNDVLHTLNPGWISKGRFFDQNTNRSVSITTTTIDCLFEEYGEFDHIKIDVEGYENVAILGMTKKYCPIQFEWASEWVEEITMDVLKHLISLNYSQFNIAYGNPTYDFDPTNLPDDYLSLSELIEEIKNINQKHSHGWGMILAR